MMRTVRLELARCREFPEGSAAHGYELHVPLAAEGKLDRQSWLTHRAESVCRRFWGDPVPHTWLALAFARGSAPAEAILCVDDHRFAVGEYMSIKERGRRQDRFRRLRREKAQSKNAMTQWPSTRCSKPTA
jgi:hypothetical protein